MVKKESDMPIMDKKDIQHITEDMVEDLREMKDRVYQCAGSPGGR